MDTFNYKCPGCGDNLTYDVKSKLMFCNSCGEFYPIDEAKTNVKFEAKPDEKTETETDAEFEGDRKGKDNLNSDYDYNPNYMEVNIFHCSSCGAEIMTNDVEVSKFCAYCGQSTIVFDRVSKELRPDVILPFRLTKQEAINRVLNRFLKAKCIADEIENISVDSVYGIYMPYWLYDVWAQLGVKGDFKCNKTTYHLDEVGDKEMTVSLDASKRLNDDISLLLNPFPTDEVEEFDSAYLSGFYADRFDVSYEKRKSDAEDVITDILEEELIEGKPGVPTKQMRDTYGEVYKTFRVNQITRYAKRCDIKNIRYAFLPVYFITFRIKEKLVNILVNGAGGKVIGSVPVDEEKLRAAEKRGMIGWGIGMGIAGALLFGFMPLVWSIMVMGAFTFCICFSGKKAKAKFEKIEEETNSESMFDISRNRE